MDEAQAALKGCGELVIDGLIWGLQQDDIDLKLLVLQRLQEHYSNAEGALPAVRALISDNEDRLVRVTAINTANVMGDRSDYLIPLLTPRLESDDDFERICGVYAEVKMRMSCCAVKRLGRDRRWQRWRWGIWKRPTHDLDGLVQLTGQAIVDAGTGHHKSA